MKLFNKQTPIKGEINIPGDKSISHRSIMFGSLAKGSTKISNFLHAEDCLSTISCFRKMGIEVAIDKNEVIVHGKGLHGLSAPKDLLYTGNSGTTTRLISGILAAQKFDCRLTGDESIERRPMKRILTPLREMGANITSIRNNDCAPLEIKGSALHGIHYHSPIASAQVKSAILLAGLYADGETSVTEPALSRNHTELMLKNFGCDIDSLGKTATLKPGNELYACDIIVPSDISSAAFFIVAGLVTPNSELLIRNVGINPTRSGIIKVVQDMNGNIELLNQRLSGGEPVADILVKSSNLIATTIEGDIIPTLIDEIPALCILASLAKGTTIIKDAAELKVKESDRITAMCENLNNLGIKATPTEDGMIIEGSDHICGGKIKSYGDHRIAMSFAIASLISDSGITIDDFDCINISYPKFFETLKSVATNLRTEE
ncbi:MAG: 3-phosphoshikimate 1-carboxyvinyltransferase [Lachnospiraceae bacterium]|nr:3-phosphoshikimate 1-carboxyvinyltransferase [Lachnospiraceae bacterium]